MNRISVVIGGTPIRLLLPVVCLHMAAAWALGGSKVVDEEVIDKWKAYESFARCLQGTARVSKTWDSGKTEGSRSVYKQNRECVLWFFSEEQRSTEICRLSNPLYAAILNRSKSDATQVVLERITQDPKGYFPGYKVSALELFRHGISPHFCSVGSMPLSQFVADPTITVLKVSKEQDNGHELIRVDYAYSRDDSENAHQVRARGSLFLDPSRSWCVRRSQLSSTSTRKGEPLLESAYEREFETVDHPSGFPLIKTCISRDNQYPYKTKKRLVSTTRTDYEWEVNNSVPDSEFTLSAFGLPEPGGAELVKKPMPIYLWILIGAGVCAVLALGFRYLARRPRAKPAA